MITQTTDDYAGVVSQLVLSERVPIANAWLARLRQLLTVQPNEVFPSNDLLDHIPSLITEIAAYLRAPEEEEIAANAAVIDKARELVGEGTTFLICLRVKVVPPIPPLLNWTLDDDNATDSAAHGTVRRAARFDPEISLDVPRLAILLPSRVVLLTCDVEERLNIRTTHAKRLSEFRPDSLLVKRDP